MTNPLFTAPRLLAYLLANMASDFENILSSTKLTPELYTGKDSSLLPEDRQTHHGRRDVFPVEQHPFGAQWPGLDNWPQIVSFKAVLRAFVSNPKTCSSGLQILSVRVAHAPQYP
jgi:hypothetical protein